DYFPGQIQIGGSVSRALAEGLAKAITDARVSLEWGGTDFSPEAADGLLVGVDADTKLLQLYDDQAKYGWFEELEAWLAEHNICFDRQSDARYEFDGQAVSFRPGLGTITSTATQDGDA